MKNSKNIKSTFFIDKPTTRNMKYFKYRSKQYSINFDLILLNSNYFYKTQEQYKHVEYIPLLNDKEEECMTLKEESIESFIRSLQNQQFELSYLTVHEIQYLSTKYEYPALTMIIDKFIEEHSTDLLIKTLLFKLKIKEIKTNNNEREETFYNTDKEEAIISKNIKRYINDEEMLELPIAKLERIIKKYYEIKQQKNEENQEEEELIEFIFKALDRYGKDASILFNNIDFKRTRQEVVQRLLTKYSDRFDFNMINSTLFKTITDITSEMTRQKEEYEKAFNEMKNEFTKRIEELRLVQEEEKRAKEEHAKQLENMKIELSSEIERIKKKRSKTKSRRRIRETRKKSQI